MNIIFHLCQVCSTRCHSFRQLILPAKPSLVCILDTCTELYYYLPKKAWLSVQLCGAQYSPYTFSEMSACSIQFRLVTFIWWRVHEPSTTLQTKLSPRHIAEWSLMLRSTIYNNPGSGERVFVCVWLRGYFLSSNIDLLSWEILSMTLLLRAWMPLKALCSLESIARACRPSCVMDLAFSFIFPFPFIWTWTKSYCILVGRKLMSWVPEFLRPSLSMSVRSGVPAPSLTSQSLPVGLLLSAQKRYWEKGDEQYR